MKRRLAVAVKNVHSPSRKHYFFFLLDYCIIIDLIQCSGHVIKNIKHASIL